MHRAQRLPRVVGREWVDAGPNRHRQTGRQTARQKLCSLCNVTHTALRAWPSQPRANRITDQQKAGIRTELWSSPSPTPPPSCPLQQLHRSPSAFQLHSPGAPSPPRRSSRPPLALPALPRLPATGEPCTGRSVPAVFSPLHSRAGKHLPALLAPLWETISFLGHQSTLLAHGQLLANHWLNIGLRLVEQHSAGVQPMGTIQPRLGLCVGLPKQQRGSTAGKGCGKGEVTSPRPMKTKGCELIAEPRAAPRLSPKLNCVCVQENTRCSSSSSSSRRVLPCSYLHGTQLMLTPSGRARKGGDGDRTGTLCCHSSAEDL